MDRALNIVVIGAGAIGGWAGGRLALAGHRVTLVGRHKLARAVAENGGLCLHAPEQAEAPETLAPVRVVTATGAAARYGPFDLALFTVKTFDTAGALVEMRAADLGQPVVVSLQNGVWSEEVLATAFGAARVVAGTVLNPISVPEPGTVVLEKQRGGIGLAPVAPDATRDASLEPWVKLLDGAVLPTRAYGDYRAMKWSKLVMNLIGNASAAILDMSTVEVFADPRLLRLEIQMLREAVAAMRRLGLKPVALPGYPVPLLASAVRFVPPALLGIVLRKMVAGGRGDKPPSLLLEMRRGRGRSEVADLNGAVVHAGEQTGLPTPVNRALTDVLARLVDGRLDWDNVRGQPGVLLAVTAEMQRKAARATGSTD
jgi:2-dehydropantoate 2-reductase